MKLSILHAYWLGSVLVLALSAPAQGNWGLTPQDTSDRLVTNPTSDKNVNVTNKSSAQEGVRVRVYDDTNNDGNWDDGEPVTTNVIIEKGESMTVGVPAGKECDVELVNVTTSASGDWKYV